MKIRHFFIIPACALCLAFSASPSFAGKIGKDCTYKGKNLYGKVQVVDAFPDFQGVGRFGFWRPERAACRCVCQFLRPLAVCGAVSPIPRSSSSMHSLISISSMWMHFRVYADCRFVVVGMMRPLLPGSCLVSRQMNASFYCHELQLMLRSGSLPVIFQRKTS